MSLAKECNLKRHYTPEHSTYEKKIMARSVRIKCVNSKEAVDLFTTKGNKLDVTVNVELLDKQCTWTKN
jgi:hypothetical protein